jgi:acetyl-CoA C-acetyltransferase
VGVYSSEPPTNGFVHVDPATTQAEVDALPARAVAGPYTGEATIEATAVVFERSGTPAVAVVSLLADDGRRLLATTHDDAVMTSMTTEAWEGRRVCTTTDGTTNTLVA